MRISDWSSDVCSSDLTDNTITDPESLEAALKIIRRDDYAINDQENAIGLIGLAVPIRDAAGRVVAALAVHAPEPRMSLDRARTYLPTLRAAAVRLGKALTDESGEMILCNCTRPQERHVPYPSPPSRPCRFPRAPE